MSTPLTLYFSIPDSITDLRRLLRDEKRKADKYGDDFLYPEIFEINNIKVKWDEPKDHSISPPPKMAKKDSLAVSKKYKFCYNKLLKQIDIKVFHD